MNKERRYQIRMMSGEVYLADEEDLKKLKENANEMLVTIKQGILHPASISDIKPYYLEYIPKTSMQDGAVTISGMKPPLPIEDLFSDKLLLN